MKEYDIVEAFRVIENELIASMMRNMDRHRAEEDEEGIQWSQWQAEQLKALERYKKENQKKYQEQFDNINAQIGFLIREARERGGMAQEISILNAIKNGFESTKRVSKGASAEFIKLNDKKLDVLIQATTNDMKKAETAVLRMANDQYRKAIFNAQVYANAGAATYEKAVDMAVKDMLAAGLNCVEYANGARHTLRDYADMAIRTANKRAYLQGEGEKRQALGVSTVIVNKRGNPCPKCLPFCGKVLIDDVWSGGSEKDGDYPLMSYAISKGLYHPRCKDVHSTYYPGISTADDTWTEKELEAVGLKARQEAEQQYAARQAEKYGRLAEYSLDEDNRKNYRRKANEWDKRSKGWIQRLKENFVPRYQEKIDNFETGLTEVKNTDVKLLLEQAQERIEFQRSQKKRSYFSRRERIVYIADSATASTIAHELFHEIDDMYGISESGILTASIRKDFRRLNNLANGYGKTLEEMLYSKYPKFFKEPKKGKIVFIEKCRGISDILNGMSAGAIELGYGHTEEYWEKPLRLERETWAQYGRMLYEEEEAVLQVLEDLFPETTQTIQQVLERMVK